MKPLLIIATNFVGGPEQQILMHLRELLAHGHQPVLVSFDEPGGRDLTDRASELGVLTFRLPHRKRELPGALSRFLRILDVTRPDLLCAQGFKAVGFGVAARLTRGLPVIGVSRGWTDEGWKVDLYNRLDKLGLRLMRRVVAVSHAQARKVVDAGVPESRVEVIHNAVRLEPRPPGSPRSDSLAVEMGIAPDVPIIFTAGRLSEEKGHRVLVDAAERLAPESGAHIVIAGSGALEPQLRERISELDPRIAARIHLPGFRTDVDRLYEAADVFVLPSYSEGLPNVVLEAVARGVPVVSTDVGGVREIIDDESGWLVPAGDPAALAAALSSALADADERRTRATRAQTHMLSEFGLAQQTQRWLTLYEQLRSDRVAIETSTTTATRPRPTLLLVDDLRGVSGGAEMQFMALCDRAATLEIDPHIVVLRGDLPAERDWPHAPVVLGFERFTPLQLFSALRRLGRLVREHEIESVYCLFPDACLLGALLLSWHPHLNLITTKRNVEAYPGILGLKERFALRFSSCVISNSDAIRNAVHDWYGVPQERIVVGRNFELPFERRGTTEPANHAELRHALAGRTICLSLANLRPVKGLEDLVDAAAIACAEDDELRFVVLGEGELRPALEERIRALGLTDRFHLPGWTDNPSAWIEASAIGVTSSHKEGFSNGLVELLRMGCPCVATEVGGNVEALDAGRAGILVPAQQPERLAAALLALSRNAPERARLGAAGRAHIEALLSEDAIIAAYKAVFHHTAQGSPALPATGPLTSKCP